MPKKITNTASDTQAGNELTSHVLATLNNLDDPVVILDKNWRYMFINETGSRVLEKSEQEVLGQNIWELFPDLENSTFKKRAYDAMQSQIKLEIEEYYPSIKKWYKTQFYPSENMLMIYLANITELQRAQEMNTQLMGDLEVAMEIYWSEENRARREARQQQKHPKP